MKRFSFICLTIIAMSFFASCRGPMGPAGPAGQDGNANVVSSTLTIHSEDWYWDNGSWRVDVDYDAINANIYNTGAVFVYMKEGNTWRQIPLTFYYSQYDDNGVENFYSSSLEVSYYQGGVSIFWTENDFYDGFRPENRQFKIVVLAAGLYNARQDVDYSNYEEVKTVFQLAD